MASLTRNTQRDWKVRYRIYYPDGSERVAYAFRAAKRDAEILLGQASQLESITRQNALTPETAVPFLHWRLLKTEDVARWFPGRRGPLSWDPDALLARYLKACHERMTSPSAIHRNGFRAEKLLDRLGNLSRLTVEDVRAWRQERLRSVSRKTVNLARRLSPAL